MLLRRAFRSSARHSGLVPAVLLLLASCGGATTAAKAPAQRAGSESTSGAGDATGADGSRAAPELPSCGDGTCFKCGDAICPTGFYCDRKAPGGPACSWLPDCAKQATCSCVQHVLGSGCSCESQGGGVYVDCE